MSFFYLTENIFYFKNSITQTPLLTSDKAHTPIENKYFFTVKIMLVLKRNT